MGKDISKLSCLLHFCDGGSCRKAGSEQLVRDARAYLKNAGAWNTVHTIKTRCNGRCEDAPTMIVQGGNFWYKNLNSAKVKTIIQSHLERGLPVEEFLLFKPGWEKVHSEKERPKEATQFKWTTDPALGAIWLLKMSSSDQVLYPLFQFIFEKYNLIEIQLPGVKSIYLNSVPLVEYSDTFDIWVKGAEFDISLAIAPIPADAPAHLAERKVGIVELLEVSDHSFQENVISGREKVLIKASRKGLRLKNRKGKELLQIWFKDQENIIWNHILENYLELNASETLIKTYEQS